MVSELRQTGSHITYLLPSYLPQQWHHVSQLGIFHVIIPSFNKNAVVFLKQEVFGQVIYYDRCLERSAKFRKIFYDQWSFFRPVYCMLSVKTMLNVLFVGVQRVKYPVRIVLHSGCENNYFEILWHFLQELNAKGTYSEKRFAVVLLFVVDKVDQGLIEV